MLLIDLISIWYHLKNLAITTETFYKITFDENSWYCIWYGWSRTNEFWLTLDVLAISQAIKLVPVVSESAGEQRKQTKWSSNWIQKV